MTLDHCSARKILDNVVGIDSAWAKKIGSPAYKNTSREQLQASIDLGDAILRGDADLVGLDSKSLTLRGKPSKNGNKAKLETGEHRSQKKDSSTTVPTVQIGSRRLGLASSIAEFLDRSIKNACCFFHHEKRRTRIGRPKSPILVLAHGSQLGKA